MQPRRMIARKPTDNGICGRGSPQEGKGLDKPWSGSEWMRRIPPSSRADSRKLTPNRVWPGRFRQQSLVDLHHNAVYLRGRNCSTWPPLRPILSIGCFLYTRCHYDGHLVLFRKPVERWRVQYVKISRCLGHKNSSTSRRTAVTSSYVCACRLTLPHGDPRTPMSQCEWHWAWDLIGYFGTDEKRLEPPSSARELTMDHCSTIEIYSRVLNDFWATF